MVDIWKHAYKNQDLDKLYTYEYDWGGLSGTDPYHPNDKGHQLIAQYLHQQLEGSK